MVAEDDRELWEARACNFNPRQRGVSEHLGQRDDGYAQRVLLVDVTNRGSLRPAKLVVKTPARRGVIGDLVHVAEDAFLSSRRSRQRWETRLVGRRVGTMGAGLTGGGHRNVDGATIS
jgi:hypothetical protein